MKNKQSKIPSYFLNFHVAIVLVTFSSVLVGFVLFLRLVWLWHPTLKFNSAVVKSFGSEFFELNKLVVILNVTLKFKCNLLVL